MRRVEHDLAAVALHGRPAIGKAVDLVGIRCLETPDTEWATCRGQVGTSLTRSDDVHHRAEIRVDPLVGGSGH